MYKSQQTTPTDLEIFFSKINRQKHSRTVKQTAQFTKTLDEIVN